MGNLSALANNVVQTTPVGVIEAFAGVNAPAGWLFCDGSAVSRVQYPELFSALSTTYGSGDGSTTFNIPDMRGRIPVGKGTHTDVATLGNNEGASLANRRPKHQHTVYDPGHTHSESGAYHTGLVSAAGGAYGVYASNNPSTGSSGTNIKVNPEGASSSTSPSNAPAYLVVNYIIKAVADLPRGGWFYQNQPPVVTQLPSNPQIGEEAYHYINGKIYAKRYNGSAWESLINANATDLPTGTVIQAVTRTTSANNSSFNGFIYSDCYCYITPQFSTSRILVMVSASVWHSSGGDSGYGGGIYSNVGGQLIQISRVGHGYDGSAGGGSFNGLSYLASPNTTSNHYYQLTLDAYRNNQGTTVQLNRSYQQTDYSTMTLLEIR